MTGSEIFVQPQVFDIIIIGAGPAGLTAGLYAVRAGRSVLCLEQLSPGGQAATTWQVDNYPGIPHVNGSELMQRIESQVRELGLTVISDQVVSILPGKPHSIQGIQNSYYGRTVIVATGAVPKKIGIPGEAEFRGRGVSYCATCDGAFFKNMPVAVIGGGNAALEEADFLTRFASKVYIVHRRVEFRADKTVQAHITKNPKIEIVTPYVPYRIEGNEKGVIALSIGPRNDKICRNLEVRGIFVFIGIEPQTDAFKDILKLDEYGYIRTNEDFQTNQNGIFAAGDCRINKVKQIIVAAGEGATAAIMADQYLMQLHN